MIQHRRSAVHATGMIMLVATLMLSFLSCSDEPTLLNGPQPGFNLSDVVIHDTTITASSDSVYRTYVPMNDVRNLLGRFEGYVGKTLIQFLPSTFPTRDTINILSARLVLRAVNWFGDSTGTFAFNVYRVRREWSQFTCTWDTVHQTDFYDSTAARGFFSGTVHADAESISVFLDTAMVREWFRTSTDTTTTKYGIILVPTTGTGVVRGINAYGIDSVQFRPRLEVIARGQTIGGPSDTSSYDTAIDTFVGNIDGLGAVPGTIFVQAGVVYRTLMRFDVSFIPRGATVASAELQLVRNPAASRLNKFTTDSLVSVHILRDATDLTQFEARRADGRRLEGTSTLFSFNVGYAIQYWIRGENHGLILRTPNEYASFDRYAFYSTSAADTTVRPRIKISYVTQKE